MGANTMIPPPPPGFDTEVTSQDTDIPPPPSGFDTEVTSQPKAAPSKPGFQWLSDMGDTPSPTGKNPVQSQMPNLPNAAKSSGDDYQAGATVPVEQRLLDNASAVAGGYELAKGGVGVASKIGSLFKASPDLLNAGIKPTTVLKMTPHGQNPAEFGTALESSLNKSGAIGKDASDTWSKMNSLHQSAGKNVGNSLKAIADAGGPDALGVNADTALKPIVDGWAERAGSATTQRKAMARPFEQIYNSLAEKAASNGGKITLDHVHDAMQEIGPMIGKGSEASQEAMSELYGALADSRDHIINAVAKQAKNPQLAKNLLQANADYSKYTRLMPDVSRASASSAVKPAKSAVQKFITSPYVKGAAAVGVGQGAIHYLTSIFGSKNE